MWSGAALFLLRDLHGAVQRGRRPVHGADLLPCLAIRQAPAGELLAFYDPGEPWRKWGCPIQGCGQRVIGPDELEGHTATEHPGWVARYDLLRPYPNQLQRVVVRRVE